ncbi:GNAT family N-acetyltransferase [Erythrobacter mangrovi]|uniref:GNAT family N-acetyltransferase n=1 Tax=Erythrobacter mangrovi TaxID=2739433 RepID=A0A7D3XGL3_9SPHN|nr:GNAT family N-acetyltransferase [Erythrobacter mangrovi]QKG70358.1 GNAT family N-acetyltransferase [Erythrobacter mangrovi]
MDLRLPLELELGRINALILRSKAFWGYDDAFMDLCREELSLVPRDLATDPVAIAVDGDAILGVVQLSCERAGCYLEKLFVEPAAMGRGLGRLLFTWAVDQARLLGAASLIIEADPGARPFYHRMGCFDAGEVPSGSIAGRMLPRLRYSLDPGP